MCNERFILFSTIFKQLVQTLNIPIAVECQVKQVIYTVMPLLSAKLAKTAPRVAATKLVQITDFILAVQPVLIITVNCLGSKKGLETACHYNLAYLNFATIII